MDSDEGKLFIGGIAWDTSEEKLRDYFSQFGEVIQAVIMRDKTTGRPRGFGFVVFSDPSVLDQVLQDKHTIDGRQVFFYFFPLASSSSILYPHYFVVLLGFVFPLRFCFLLFSLWGFWESCCCR